jgi:hypothetical protein
VKCEDDPIKLQMCGVILEEVGGEEGRWGPLCHSLPIAQRILIRIDGFNPNWRIDMSANLAKSGGPSSKRIQDQLQKLRSNSSLGMPFPSRHLKNLDVEAVSIIMDDLGNGGGKRWGCLL